MVDRLSCHARLASITFELEQKSESHVHVMQLLSAQSSALSIVLLLHNFPQARWDRAMRSVNQANKQTDRVRAPAAAEDATTINESETLAKNDERPNHKIKKERRASTSLASAMTTRPFERSAAMIDVLSRWARKVKALQDFPPSARAVVVTSALYEEHNQEGIELAYNFTSDLAGIVVRGQFEIVLASVSDRVAPHHGYRTTVVGPLECFGTGFAPATGVKSLGPAAILLFSRATLDRATTRIAETEVEEKFSALMRVPTLTLWVPSDQQSMCALFRWCTAKSKEILAREGHRATHFYVIVSGRCTVYRNTRTRAPGEGGGSVTRAAVGDLCAGACFGEMSVFGQLPCAAHRFRDRAREAAIARGDHRPSDSDNLITCTMGSAGDDMHQTEPEDCFVVEPFTVQAAETTRLLCIDTNGAQSE